MAPRQGAPEVVVIGVDSETLEKALVAAGRVVFSLVETADRGGHEVERPSLGQTSYAELVAFWGTTGNRFNNLNISKIWNSLGKEAHLGEDDPASRGKVKLADGSQVKLFEIDEAASFDAWEAHLRVGESPDTIAPGYSLDLDALLAISEQKLDPTTNIGPGSKLFINTLLRARYTEALAGPAEQ